MKQEKEFNSSLRHIRDPPYAFVAIGSTSFYRKKIQITIQN